MKRECEGWKEMEKEGEGRRGRESKREGLIYFPHLVNEALKAYLSSGKKKFFRRLLIIYNLHGELLNHR